MADLIYPNGFSLPAVVTITNNYPVPATEGNEEESTTPWCLCDKVWNTGLNMLDGEPALIDDDTILYPELIKGQIAVPVYGNRNLYFKLNAGQSASFEVNTDEQAIFYLNLAQNDKLIGVTITTKETGTTATASDADSL